MTCAFDHTCTIGDPLPVKNGEPCCEICTACILDLGAVGPEMLGTLIQDSLQRHGGPYLGALVVEGVAADVLASLQPGNSPIYGESDIAESLGVPRQQVGNWSRRYDLTPRPTFTTPKGKKFWDENGRRAWIRWRASRAMTWRS